MNDWRGNPGFLKEVTESCRANEDLASVTGTIVTEDDLEEVPQQVGACASLKVGGFFHEETKDRERRKYDAGHSLECTMRRHVVDLLESRCSKSMGQTLDWEITMSAYMSDGPNDGNCADESALFGEHNDGQYTCGTLDGEEVNRILDGC